MKDVGLKHSRQKRGSLFQLGAHPVAHIRLFFAPVIPMYRKFRCNF
jgi:hypothetical protein